MRVCVRVCVTVSESPQQPQLPHCCTYPSVAIASASATLGMFSARNENNFHFVAASAAPAPAAAVPATDAALS